MRRSNAVRETEQAQKHDPSNPFCAAHPDIAAHGPSTRMSDEEPQTSFRAVEQTGARAHVSAEHVFVQRKKK